MIQATTIAVDLAKNVFELAFVDARERVLSRRRVSRQGFRKVLATHPPVDLVMEGCGTGHYWARAALAHGHRPTLLPPAYTKPFVLRNKTDRTDVSGLLAARRHPDMKAIAVKTEHQQTMTAIHKLREAWKTARTRRINTVRAVLRELGLVIPQGASNVLPRLHAIEGGHEVPASLLPMLAEARHEIEELQRRMREVDRHLRSVARENETTRRLMTIPGIGPITATAVVAFVGDLSRFPSGRHFASFLGLTPREYSSGGTRRLGRISKRGNAYLRTLLIHGGRSALQAGKHSDEPDGLRRWALRLEARTCHNVAAVGLANKLARIAWAVATRDAVYRPEATR